MGEKIEALEKDMLMYLKEYQHFMRRSRYEGDFESKESDRFSALTMYLMAISTQLEIVREEIEELKKEKEQ